MVHHGETASQCWNQVSNTESQPPESLLLAILICCSYQFAHIFLPINLDMINQYLLNKWKLWYAYLCLDDLIVCLKTLAKYLFCILINVSLKIMLWMWYFPGNTYRPLTYILSNMTSCFNHVWIMAPSRERR